VPLQVTPKTLADVKGGTLISYEGKVQVHTSHLVFTTHFFPASSSAVQQKWIKFQKDLCINYAKLHLLNLQMTLIMLTLEVLSVILSDIFVLFFLLHPKFQF
jgi:UDP-N-acetylglucosamine pyrophosphorylase